MGGTMGRAPCSGEQAHSPFGCRFGCNRGGDLLMPSTEIDAAPISEPMCDPDTNSRNLELMSEPDVNVPHYLLQMNAQNMRAMSKNSDREEFFPPHQEESCCILVIGSSGVGKTTLVHTVLNGMPPETLRKTTPTVFLSKVLPFEAENITHLRLSVFDCNGTIQGFKAAKALSVRANAYILCFDLTDAESFEALGDEYIDIIAKGDRHKAIVVGLKLDLAITGKRAVRRSQLVAFEEDEGVLCSIELSSIPSENGTTQRNFLDALKRVHDVEAFESSSKTSNREPSQDSAIVIRPITMARRKMSV
eukprot:GEMP01034250.1.p1 GENE.GEMP01034250.1~~GEMP01034250.1.p1  ORF type:complete len:305 (+),score=48.88 GEMP01034250.1:245-1159(+)